MFAGMKKKSKKKQVAMDLGDSVPAEEHAVEAPKEAEPVAVPPPAVIETPKGKEEEPATTAPVEADAPPAGDGGDPFADLKKKKKKKKEIPLDLVSPSWSSRRQAREFWRRGVAIGHEVLARQEHDLTLYRNPPPHPMDRHQQPPPTDSMYP